MQKNRHYIAYTANLNALLGVLEDIDTILETYPMLAELPAYQEAIKKALGCRLAWAEAMKAYDNHRDDKDLLLQANSATCSALIPACQALAALCAGFNALYQGDEEILPTHRRNEA